MNENPRTTDSASNDEVNIVDSADVVGGAATPTSQREELSGTCTPTTRPATSPATGPAMAKPEHGGPKGLEPTRYGDWERNGRCYDF